MMYAPNSTTGHTCNLIFALIIIYTLLSILTDKKNLTTAPVAYTNNALPMQAPQSAVTDNHISTDSTVGELLSLTTTTATTTYVSTEKTSVTVIGEFANHASTYSYLRFKYTNQNFSVTTLFWPELACIFLRMSLGFFYQLFILP